MKLQQYLQKLIAKGNLEAAVDTLLEIQNLGRDLENEITLLSSRFYTWKREKLLELDTPDNIRVRKNKMVRALNLLIEDLPETAQVPKKQRSSFFSFLSFSQNTTTSSETDAFAQEKDKIRSYLIERYTERLRQKTDHRLPVSLQLTYSKEGTSPDYPHFSKDIRLSEPIEETLTQTLQKHRHLLIIGNPGAGKTTQILELAKDWLTEKTDEKLPIVFNLASWKPENHRFHEWLQQALVSGYGFSKKLAQEAILTNQILPLLDGLDEVGRDLKDLEKRNDVRCQCLHTIDEYLSLFEVEYLTICSRRKEYAAINIDAPVKAQILVNPLTPIQIKATLKDSLQSDLSNRDENAVHALLHLLETHPTLKEVLCTPFYYNLALEVFDTRMLDKDLPQDKEALERYLLEEFIAEKIETTENPKGFNAENSRRYLSFLGDLMNEENKVNYEIVDLQPRHLEKDWKMYLILALVIGIIFGMWLELSIGLLIICVGVIPLLNKKLNLSESLTKELNQDLIKPIGAQTIQWSKLRLFSTWKNGGEVLVFCIAFIIGIMFVFVKRQTSILDANAHQLTNLKLLMLIGFSILLFLFIEIRSAIINELSKKSFFYSLNTPYQSFKNDFLLKIGLAGLFALIYIPITFLLFDTNTEALVESKIKKTFSSGIFIFIISFLNINIFFHLLLRLCLFLEKKLPLQLVHFLQYATQARILEQDGGQWRFRHQILQDYFSEKWGGVNRNG